MKTTKALTLLFCLIAGIRLIIPVYENWGKFTEKYDPLLYEKKYNASQYMVPQSKHPISDEELLSHAGYKYIKGLNPILINSDHPPLGKYIIGIFTVLTGNNRVVSLFFAVLNMALLSSIIYMFCRSWFLTSLGILFLSWDPMLVDQMIHSPILDIIQVAFLLLYILLLALWIKDNKNNHYLPLMAVAIGALSSVKLYFPAIVAIAVTSLTLLMLRKPLKSIFVYLAVTVPLAFLTYAATYFRYFMEAKAFLPFFGVQKWIFLFWQNNSVNQAKVFGNVLPFILMNKWKVWWGEKEVIQYSGWTIIWPLFFLFGLIAAVYFIFTKKKVPGVALFLSLWFIFFTFYLCFVPISPRYLMMLYFPVYILVILFLKYKFSPTKHNEKNK